MASHETLMLTTADSSPWRRLPDTASTESYIMKLSHACTVYVLFDSGEAWEVYCGEIVKASMFAIDVIPEDQMPV